jgi:simple sugar transport system permease protein
MLKLEARPEASRLMTWLSPLLAIVLTLIIGSIIFIALGKDPLRGLAIFFIEPVKSLYGLSELMMKATPLILIALGLAVCFRSNVWNIGAEGQFIAGAIAAGGIALLAHKDTGMWIMPIALIFGVIGGMAWASITAFLRDKFNANEILVSLMGVYIVEQLLGYLVYGPWKDPLGYNFPQTITFLPVTKIPKLFEGLRVNIGVMC